jgi:tetratricopeptide (TPR) repeat protein
MNKICINLFALTLLSVAIYACGAKTTPSQSATTVTDSSSLAAQPDTSRRMDSIHKVSVMTDTSWSEAAKTIRKTAPVPTAKQLNNSKTQSGKPGKSFGPPPPGFNPFRPQELLDGLQKAQAGNLKGAMEDFTTAIKKNPKNYNAYFYRAKARVETGDNTGALEDINKAIENNGREAIYFYYRGKMYSDMGESGKALVDFNHAVDMRHNFTDALNYRGVEKAKMGLHKEAIKDYDSAIITNTEYPLCYYNKGTSQAALGDYKGAIETFSKAISLDGKNKLSFLNRGNCYIQLANYKSAIADYTSVIQMDPKNQDAYYNRGAAYYLQGDKAMCADWKMAAALGNVKAKSMLEKNCK